MEVSRSFALIIPECPPPIDRAMCVAYLLCRIADTIEDEPALPAGDRGDLYRNFLACVDAPGRPDLLEVFLARWPAVPFSEEGYRTLVLGTGRVLSVYRTLPGELMAPIRQCVHDMVEGMRRVRPAEHRGGIDFYCRDLPALDEYCHFVAGTVGIMSTAMFGWHLAPGGFTVSPAWQEQGRRLGLGLQMTNIIKDCRVDARRGVSYIPARYVADAPGGGLRPESCRDVYTHAISHLDAGLAYTMAVPRSEAGIRRFLLGSLLPAIATLEMAATTSQVHPRIDRDKMMEILELITAPDTSDAAIIAWYRAHCDRLLAALPAA